MSPLNSPHSVCAKHKFHRNWNIYRSSSTITKNIVRNVHSMKLHKNWSICCFFIQNYGLKDDRYQLWEVSTITKNYRHQWIQYLQVVHCAKFCWKWLTSFPVPHSLFPIPFLKISPHQKNIVCKYKLHGKPIVKWI